MNRERGPAASRRQRARRLLTSVAVAVASTLLCSACRRADASDSPIVESGEAAASVAARNLEGVTALSDFHRRLTEVRSALDRDAPVQAGRFLSATLRILEQETDSSRKAFEPATAGTFEEVRRAADRWQAGVAPSRGEAHRVLGDLDREALRLLWAKGEAGGAR